MTPTGHFLQLHVRCPCYWHRGRPCRAVPLVFFRVCADSALWQSKRTKKKPQYHYAATRTLHISLETEHHNDIPLRITTANGFCTSTVPYSQGPSRGFWEPRLNILMGPPKLTQNLKGSSDYLHIIGTKYLL